VRGGGIPPPYLTVTDTAGLKMQSTWVRGLVLIFCARAFLAIFSIADMQSSHRVQNNVSLFLTSGFFTGLDKLFRL
jgi:hypothetical protein